MYRLKHKYPVSILTYDLLDMCGGVCTCRGLLIVFSLFTVPDHNHSSKGNGEHSTLQKGKYIKAKVEKLDANQK